MKFLMFLFLLTISPILMWANIVFEKANLSATAPINAKTVDFEFLLKNSGTESVEILEMKSSCDCTVAKVDKKIYASNESGKITATFTIGERIGKHSKQVNVKTSEGKTYILNLTLRIPELASFRPKMLMWKIGGDADTKTLHIDTAREYGAIIVSAECDNKNFKIDFTPQKENTDSCKLKITPLNLEKPGTSELKLLCKVRGGEDKKYTLHLLIR